MQFIVLKSVAIKMEFEAESIKLPVVNYVSEFSSVDVTENNSKTSSTSWDDNIKHYLLLLGERGKDLNNINRVRKLIKDTLMIGESPILYVSVRTIFT